MSEYDITKSWLGSNSFIKRAFAIYGYVLAAILMVWLGLLALIFVFALIGTALGLN